MLLRAGFFPAGAGFAVARVVAGGDAEGTVVVTTEDAFGVTSVGAAESARLFNASTRAPAASTRVAAPRTIAPNLIRASEPAAASRLDTNCRSADRQLSSNDHGIRSAELVERIAGGSGRPKVDGMGVHSSTGGGSWSTSRPSCWWSIRRGRREQPSG